MKVYELIQILCQQDPQTEVYFGNGGFAEADQDKEHYKSHIKNIYEFYVNKQKCIFLTDRE